jgi:hypothetical protein
MRSIRKVQTSTDHPVHAVTPHPFPPGLRIVFTFCDPDEMSERVAYWGIEL